MLSNEKTLNDSNDSNSLDNDNKKFNDISTSNGKIYDINEDFLNNSNSNNGLSLSTLKKFKTFKEYKESLKNTPKITTKPISKKKDVLLDKIGNKKITDLSSKNLNLKFEKWDKKANITRKNILQDLQNTREQFLKEKHKTYHKLRIPNFGYPNIKKISRSTTLPKSSPKSSTLNDNGSSYVENLKKEALSLAEKMKKIDENASEDIIKRFEKITNDSMEKRKTSPQNDNFNKLIMKELKNNRPTKRENSKYDLLITERRVNKNISSKLKKNVKTKDNKNDKTQKSKETKDKIENKSKIDKDKEKEKGEEVQEKRKKDNEEENKASMNREESYILDSNITKITKKYNDENMKALVDDLTLNISSPISYSKNITEKSKKIKEKRKLEKKKVIEKLEEMKKIQQERIQNIEKESSEWKKTITDIEKQLASLKDSINNTDGLFSNLFKKGKELELEIDSIRMKNK
ncbi:hypothetical protein PIROE2DRAFT_19186, partial [Piromyces sp. E2]